LCITIAFGLSLSRRVIPGKGLWFRVRVGRYPSREHAAGDLRRLAKDNPKAIVMHNE
jgi:cell division protein FtsN